MALAIGMIEILSMPTGLRAADAMAKAAAVELLVSRTICPGKYITIVGGDVGAVRSSLQAGIAEAGDLLADKLLLPSVHPSVLPAFHLNPIAGLDDRVAVGAVETYTVAASIVAADAAVKASQVSLLEIRPGIGYGGKGYFVVAGEVSAVQSAIDAGLNTLEPGSLVDKVVIPNLHRDLIHTLL